MHLNLEHTVTRVFTTACSMLYFVSLEKIVSTGAMELYTQALKVLAVKSPYGLDDQGAGGPVTSTRAPHMIKLSSTNIDSNKRKNRARKTQPSSKKRSFDESVTEANPKHFWLQMEDYFREVTAEDMEVLLPMTTLRLGDGGIASDPCFWFPPVVQFHTEALVEVQADAHEAPEEILQQDSLRGLKRKLLIANDENKKKTKTSISTEAQMITTVISPPDQDDEELCHVCNFGDSEESNQILFCDSCSVAVHQECYGVSEVPAGQWLCSWCSYIKSENHKVAISVESSWCEGTQKQVGCSYNCVLCTVNGGALKPVASPDVVESGRKFIEKKFAHLFCCQWVPETYIQDIEVMEPIKNVEGVREERWRLVCMICRAKHGACIQCSHGLCAASFHPLCAREAKFWMEVSSREDSEEVELRAYCPKHSSVRVSRPVDINNVGDENIKHSLSMAETTSLTLEKIGSREVKLKPNNRNFRVAPFLKISKDQTSGRDSQSTDKVKDDQEKGWDADVTSKTNLESISYETVNGLKIVDKQSVITSRLDQLVDEQKCSGADLKEAYNGKSTEAEQDVQETSSEEFEIYSDLIQLFKKVIQQTHESPAAVALQAGIPLSTLSRWLEGKTQIGGDNISGSIRAWLWAQNKLADDYSRKDASKEPDLDASCQETVFSKGRYNMDVSPEEDSITSSLSHHSGKNGLSKLSGIRKRKQHPSNTLETREQFGEDKLNHTLEMSANFQNASESPLGSGGALEVRQDRSSSACNNETVSVARPKSAVLKAEEYKLGLDVESGLEPRSTALYDMHNLGCIKATDKVKDTNNTSKNVADLKLSPQTLRIEVEDVDMLKGSQQVSGLSCSVDPAFGSSIIKAKTRDPDCTLMTGPLTNQGGTIVTPSAVNELSSGSNKEKQADHASVQVDAVSDARKRGANVSVSSVVVVSLSANGGQGHEGREHMSFRDTQLCAEEENERDIPQPFVHPYIVKRISHLQPSIQGCPPFFEGQGAQSSIIDQEIESPQNDDLSTSPSDCKGASRPRSITSQTTADFISADLGIVEPPSDVICAGIYTGSDQRTYSYAESKMKNVMFSDSIDYQWEQLQRARDMHLLDSALQDELEGELFCLQNKLITYAQVNCFRSEQVIAKMIMQIPKERQASQCRLEDLSLVNQYLADVRDAKKQGRKKRKEKEAQAVLAAATAAAAASSRLGYARRDGMGTSMQANMHRTEAEVELLRRDNSTPLILAAENHTSPHSSRVRPHLPNPHRFTVSTGQFSQRNASYEKGDTEKLNLAYQSSGIYSTPVGRSVIDAKCDVCGGVDSVRLNKLMNCDCCKVAVHQECYGIGKNHVGSWYCQPCSEMNLQLPSFGVGEVKGQGSHGLGVQCALCPQTSGAFKRSTDGRWVHIFCAQWTPETTVGRDQMALIEGLDCVPSERYSMVCGICQLQHGACLKCNFGHCHGAFHASCARDAGLYLNVRSNVGGHLQYRAYCHRHSPQQRAKAENKHETGLDDLSAIKQIRVELERVRLICERISRREKLKRDLLHCSKDLCITELNVMAVSGSGNIVESLGGSLAPRLSTQNFVPRNFESGQPGSCYSEDILNGVLSSSKVSKVDRHGLEAQPGPWYKDNVPSLIRQRGSAESKLENSGSMTLKSRTAERFANARNIAPANFSVIKDPGILSSPVSGASVAKQDDGSKNHRKQRRSETLDREKVMTPIEASMHNRRLPKGYAYVPVDMLKRGTLSSDIPHQDAKELQHLSDGKLPTS